jgi:hypothetical protein
VTPLFAATAAVVLAVCVALGIALRVLQRRARAEALDRAVFEDFDAALDATTRSAAGTSRAATASRA